jgi:ATP/maltotriose-dependent transcriptional regulator MalT
MKSGTPSTKDTKRFLVAFSFAGEKRDFVGQTAVILAKRFGETGILYDKFYEAQFARSDLGVHLPDLYHKESELVVLVISRDYEMKDWCGIEWTAIHALIKERRVEDVMLCRFDHALIKGLYSTAGFVELDHKSPDEVAKLIVQRLKSNGIDIRKRRRTPKPIVDYTAAVTTPNNLPRLHSFFGREKELKTIADALSPNTRTWGALIDGPGGMGKTSLAIRAAELVPAGQFQHILFLSSKERKLTAEGERRLTDFVVPGFLDMLNETARQLGQPDLAKRPENERARLLIDLLAPAQALIILDNLESLPKDQQNQLFEFLSQLPPGSKAIATSRRRTDVDARIIRLGKLDQDAALALIAELSIDRPLLAKATESERLHLYEETGGNPLLLRWIAGQLGKGRLRTVHDALNFLRQAPPGNDPLEFIFGDLLETFTENETKTLAALSYFTQAVDVEHIAELSVISKPASQTALGDLASRALVIPDEEEKKFSLVPMVADFLRRKRPEIVAEAGGRLEERAYALIVENGYEKFDAFPILDAAWSTVAPAMPLFVSGPNPRLQTICGALGSFLHFTGRWDEQLSLNQQAEEKAVAAQDYHNAGWRAFDAGWAYYLRQEADSVLACADRARVHWEAAGSDAREMANAIRLRGHGYRLRNEFSDAAEAYREALELDRGLAPESADVAAALNWLANAERDAGERDAAERDYRESLRISRAVENWESVAIATGNLALMALDEEEWTKGEVLAREALVLSEKVGRQELVAANYSRLADALIGQGKSDEALPHARQAVEMFKKLGSPILKAALAILQKCEV